MRKFFPVLFSTLFPATTTAAGKPQKLKCLFNKSKKVQE